MLFNEGSTKPSFPIFSYLWKTALAGIVGVALWFNPTAVTQPVHPNIVASAGPTVNQDVLKALQGKSLSEQEKVYKVVSGISDFLKNSERVHSNRQLREMIVECLLTYKMENYSYLQPMIEKCVDDAGIRKDDDSILKNKTKAIEVFNNLSESVKYSIQTIKDK